MLSLTSTKLLSIPKKFERKENGWKNIRKREKVIKIYSYLIVYGKNDQKKIKLLSIQNISNVYLDYDWFPKNIKERKYKKKVKRMKNK